MLTSGITFWMRWLFRCPVGMIAVIFCIKCCISHDNGPPFRIDADFSKGLVMHIDAECYQISSEVKSKEIK